MKFLMISKHFDVYERLPRILVAIGMVIVAVLFISNLIVFAGLVVLSIVLSLFVNKTNIRNIGIEFILFTTVFAGVSYSPQAGAIVGFILIVFHLIVAQYMGPYLLWVIPQYALAGFLAGKFSSLHASTLGLYLVILMNGIGIFCTLLFTREELGEYMPYTITNVIFNFLLFKFIAPIVF